MTGRLYKDNDIIIRNNPNRPEYNNIPMFIKKYYHNNCQIGNDWEHDYQVEFWNPNHEEGMDSLAWLNHSEMELYIDFFEE